MHHPHHAPPAGGAGRHGECQKHAADPAAVFELLRCAAALILSCSSLLQSLRKVGQDSTVLLICITVFLSYLPEAGQYSSFFLYLRQVNTFAQETRTHRWDTPWWLLLLKDSFSSVTADELFLRGFVFWNVQS